LSGVSITAIPASDASLSSLLKPGEQLLWTGHPEAGLGLFQPIGAERMYLVGMLLGTIAMWATLPAIAPRGNVDLLDLKIVFGVVTALFVLVAFFNAASRQHVLSSMFYVVSDRRSMVCRRGRNWHLGDRLYILSNPHSATYPYEITRTQPLPSIRIGTLLDPQQVQPFGFGLAHPGQPLEWNHHTVPVAFEQISDVEEVLEIIRANAK
jgi:hypothetical protein